MVGTGYVQKAGWLSQQIFQKALLLALPLLILLVFGTPSLQTKAQNRVGGEGGVTTAADATRTTEHEGKIACQTKRGIEWRLPEADSDDCYFNGATFADWKLWNLSIDVAMLHCSKHHWRGRQKYYSALDRKWIALSCTTYAQVFPERLGWWNP